MGDLLNFLPREQYDEQRWTRLAEEIQATTDKDDSGPAELTTQELYKHYWNETQTQCLRLVRFYKKAGVWNATFEKQMFEVVKQLQAVCQSLAQAKVAYVPAVVKLNNTQEEDLPSCG
jgi:hypothetical protein